MWFLIPIAAIILGGVALNELLDNDSEFKVTDESDSTEYFLKFNENVSILPSKKEQIKKARNVLQEKIRKYFGQKSTTSSVSFYIQGSYKHGTTIRKQDDTCDIDVGVYFSKKPTIKPLSLQNNIVAAIGSHTNETATIKDKCVRIYYANLFHIDLPIYHKENEQFYIGGGKSGWQLDDPKLFTNWLRESSKDKPQIIRLIKYFKAWSDCSKHQTKRKMPSGLALTIWVVQFYQSDDREDISFFKTAIAIRNYLKSESFETWQCNMPTAPNDSVIKKLNSQHRKNILIAFDSLIENSSKALTQNSVDGSVLIWKTVLGKWF